MATDEERDIIGSLVAANRQRKHFLLVARNERQRRDIAKEIWSTERFYNEQLLTIIEHFLKPLRQLAKDTQDCGVNDADIHSIFSHIEAIYNLSSILFDKINPRLVAWGPSQSIADIFVDMGPFLKCYKQFSENYTSAIARLCVIRASDMPVTAWLRERERDPKCRSLDLSSLLIAPIQRVPRYILLLEALLKATPSTHADHRRCETAVLLLRSIVQNVNDGIHEDHNRKKLIQLQSTFDMHIKYFGPLSVTNLVEPHRKLAEQSVYDSVRRGR
eukprot:gene7309-8506_t